MKIHLDMMLFPFLSDPWNIMDMIVVLVSLVSLSNIVEDGEGHTCDVCITSGTRVQTT